MADLKVLVGKRKLLRKLVTDTFNSIETIRGCNVVELTRANKQFLDHQAELTELNSNIQRLKYIEGDGTDEELTAELASCEDYNSKIRACLAEIDTFRPQLNQSGSRGNTDSLRTMLKGPVAPLPNYSGAPSEDITRFFRELEDTLDRFRYPEYDKFLLLKQQLSGRALTLVSSLSSENNAYTVAKKLLLDALASPESKKTNIVTQLTKLKLDLKSDPYDYISKVKLIVGAVNDLPITVDDILRHFIWNGLNDTFKTQLIQITNKTRPSLVDIMDKYFEACERYEYSTKSKKIPQDEEKLLDSYQFAVNVNPSKYNHRPCSICTKYDGKEADHPIFKCAKFPTSSDKLNILSQYGGCVKCGGFSHNTKNCRYKFKSKCSHCNSWHFSFLCDRNYPPTNPKNSPYKNDKTKNPRFERKGKERKDSDSYTVTQNMQSTAEGETLLPTFTCQVGGKTNIRCLKDGGSQLNFVTCSLADSIKLKVLKYNVRLNVNGINGRRFYRTRLVQFKMILPHGEFVVEALCIPDIDIKIGLPRLGELVAGFWDKGYVLADNSMHRDSDEISDIQLILGSKYSYCMPESETVFGKENGSVLSMTPAGVLLKGEINKLIEDVEFLPRGTNVNSFLCSSTSRPSVANDVMIDTYSFQASLGFSSLPAEFSVLTEDGCLDDARLQKAISAVLEDSCESVLDQIGHCYGGEFSENDQRLVDYALNSCYRDEDQRLVMPLLWNSQMSHLLGSNRRLSEMILKSNLKKLSRNPEHLKLMDDSIKEQISLGIIEKIPNLDKFLTEHQRHSFLPHMAVIKENNISTKCRVVFLSNLCEKDPKLPRTISHNQAIFSGPSLNQKLSSAIIHLRFNSKIICFDICKAFNNIAVSDADANRLLFLWYNNVAKKDFTVVGYRSIRLPFGLRCSPTLLMLAMYKILVMDINTDSERLVNLKKQIYQLCYMDNCAFTAKDSDNLLWGYRQLTEIFSPYSFGLQQFISNDSHCQEQIDKDYNTTTPDTVKLLGMLWDRKEDTLSTNPINLNVEANTKRAILSSIASQYDIFNFNGPLLNRSRLFLHDLQCCKELQWDDLLESAKTQEWKNIARQANSAPVIGINRYIGDRDSSFRLIAFSDASKDMYGAVIYLQDINSKNVSFLCSKNRIVNTKMSSKTIPALELQGIALAVGCLVDIKTDLSDPVSIDPIDIREMEIYSDSLVALSWVNNSVNKLEKMQKCSTFVRNRIDYICRLCNDSPITFSFIAGIQNPGDCATRTFSYKQLVKTNFLKGPDFLRGDSQSVVCRSDAFTFKVPNPLGSDVCVEMNSYVTTETPKDRPDYLVDISSYSSLNKLTNVYMYVMKFINNYLGNRLKRIYPDKTYKYKFMPPDHNFYTDAVRILISEEQRVHYSAILEYFHGNGANKKDIPGLVSRLNLFVDHDNLIRVHSKFNRGTDSIENFPLLLPKDGKLTELIILNCHAKNFHSGVYNVLSELRKHFYIPKIFSTVKKLLKNCVICKRFKERPIQLNQSPYREFRTNPPTIPFAYLFMDYMGPFFVKSEGRKSKVWILCFTCMWSRAIDLHICVDMSVSEFLRAFQLHVFKYGLPQYCISDLGTQLLAGANIIADYLNDPESKLFLDQMGVSTVKFEQFYKGRSELGSMVESCVKLVKRLVYSSIKTNVLESRDFEFLIAQANHIVNRRPVAFRDALRDASIDVPDPITPERLIHGYDLVSLNIIPQLHDPNSDPDFLANKCPVDFIKTKFFKLQKTRNNLLTNYHSEFLKELISQAVAEKDRYLPVGHKPLAIGDIVLIKENFTKPVNFPMGIVKNVLTNVNSETTGATVLKGRTGEVTKRHVSCLIPLLSANLETVDIRSESAPNSDTHNPDLSVRPKRRAAITSRAKSAKMLSD